MTQLLASSPEQTSLGQLDVTVVLPCLNEELGVGSTVRDAILGLERAGLSGEVLVVDNGSTDRSIEIAEAAGARVVCEPLRGYGAAHRRGIAEAGGRIVVMADADQTYDLQNLGDLVRELEAGVDMVVGSRLQGSIENGAMPGLHRRLGTPVFNAFLTRTTGIRISDSQSGFRAFYREPALELGLKSLGMEYASELLLRAGRRGWRITEVPSDYRVRAGESKLDTFSDGWRHLRMLLIMSPHSTLIYPGAVLLLLGLLVCALPIFAPEGVTAGGYRWLPIFFGPTLLIVGGQATFVGVLASAGNDLTPTRWQQRLGFLNEPHSLNGLLRFCVVMVLLGVAAEVVLAAVYLADLSGASLLGVAGIAHALIVVGVGGLITTLGWDAARESVWK